MELKKITPVFIIGAGHSGTTILYRMLALHPDFAWFSQYSCRGGEIPDRFRLPLYQYFNRIPRLFFAHSWLKEESKIKIIPFPKDVERIWDYIFSTDENSAGINIPEEEAISRMRKVMEAECRNWRKNFIITKNIRFHFFLPLLKKAWPGAKFVHIMRDGRAIVLSHTRSLKKAKDWTGVIERIDREKENSDFFEIRYEDFCNDVRGYLKKILNYIGLDEKKLPLDRFPATLLSRNSKLFKDANPVELAEIENIQKDVLKKYGYIK